MENPTSVVLLSGGHHSFICERDELDKLLPGEHVPRGLASDSLGMPCMYQQGEQIKTGRVQQNVSLLSCFLINYACWLPGIFLVEKRGHPPLSI